MGAKEIRKHLRKGTVTEGTDENRGRAGSSKVSVRVNEWVQGYQQSGASRVVAGFGRHVRVRLPGMRLALLGLWARISREAWDESLMLP